MAGQKQVIDELDTLAGRGMRTVLKKYEPAIVRPIVEAIGGAKSAAGALRALGPKLVRTMDESAIAEPLSETLDSAAGIGAAVASPKDASPRGNQDTEGDRAKRL